MRRKPVLVLLAGLCLAAGCSGDGTPDASDATTASGSPTTSASAVESGAPPSGSASASASGSATAGPSLSPPPPTLSPSPGTGPAVPPVKPAAFGSYAGTQQGGESFGATGGQPQRREYPKDLVLEVRRGESDDKRVFFLPYSPDRKDTLTLRFAGGGIQLVTVRSYVRVGSFEQNRSFTPLPSQVLLPAGARVGQVFSGTFSGEAEGTYSGKVLRRETLTIGGQRSETVVVDLSTYLTGGQVTGRLHTLTWWDVSRALAVEQQLETTIDDGFARYEQDVQGQLATLTPK